MAAALVVGMVDCCNRHDTDAPAACYAPILNSQGARSRKIVFGGGNDVVKKVLFIALVVAVALPAGALGVIGVTAGPALAQGPSPAQLAAQGWTCFVPPVPGIGVRCFNPAQGPPPVPPVEDGRPSYTAMAWTPAGEFEGHVHLIRADLYHGQPCEPNGGPYVFIPLIGYYECLRP
jgi:hypothetical protein